jgi:hypothetical protein
MATNQFTGIRTEFYPTLQRDLATRLRTINKAETFSASMGLFPAILAQVPTTAAAAEIGVYVLDVSDVPVKFHGEVMDLLQFGVGTVGADEKIRLVRPFVDITYGTDANAALGFLRAVLQATEVALKDTLVGPHLVHFQGEIDRIRMEVAKLLKKLGLEE